MDPGHLASLGILATTVILLEEAVPDADICSSPKVLVEDFFRRESEFPVVHCFNDISTPLQINAVQTPSSRMRRVHPFVLPEL